LIKACIDNCPSPKLYRDLFKHFFDPCPSVPAFNGLMIPWHRFNYVNPPYSNKVPWLWKAIQEQELGNTSVFLLPAATGAAWFQDMIMPYAHVHFIRGRIELDNGHHPRYDSILAIYYGHKHKP